MNFSAAFFNDFFQFNNHICTRVFERIGKGTGIDITKTGSGRNLLKKYTVTVTVIVDQRAKVIHIITTFQCV